MRSAPATRSPWSPDTRPRPPGRPFDPVFQANSNGAPFSDPKRSHGDTLQDPNETATQLTTSADFAGGFAINRNDVKTSGAVGKNNVQSTSVTPPTVGVITTAQDGLTANAFTCTGCTKTLFGDWSRVTVGDGEPFGSLFPVTLLVYGKALPKGATQDSIDLVHVLDNGSTEILSTRCGATPTLNCVTVTPVVPTTRSPVGSTGTAVQGHGLAAHALQRPAAPRCPGRRASPQGVPKSFLDTCNHRCQRCRRVSALAEGAAVSPNARTHVSPPDRPTEKGHRVMRRKHLSRALGVLGLVPGRRSSPGWARRPPDSQLVDDGGEPATARRRRQ